MKKTIETSNFAVEYIIIKTSDGKEVKINIPPYQTVSVISAYKIPNVHIDGNLFLGLEGRAEIINITIHSQKYDVIESIQNFLESL